MTPSRNPYNWQHHEPSVTVPRALVKPLIKELLDGGGAIVIGGRGMGKSVLLHQVCFELESSKQVRVLYFPSPPRSLTVEDCFATLAELLDEPAANLRTSHELFKRYFDRRPDEPVVLLFDEFDRYAQAPAPNAPVPGRLFFNDLETARRSFPLLGILAVGTLGVFVFRDVLGSSFLSRAARFWMSTFEPDEARALTRPFAERGEPLDEDVFETLLVASGAIPALLTYGLQHLWVAEERSEREVARIFTRFQDRYGEFLSDVESAFSDPVYSQIPQRMWKHICEERGPFKREDLKKISDNKDGALRLKVAEVLHLLEAAGLVRIDGSALSDDPVDVHPVASLLSLPEVSPPAAGFAVRFWRDLETLLDRLFASSADFFRPGTEKGAKRLVPESVFSAFLAMGFGLLGWDVVREAQQVAGRTDLKLRRNGSPEIAIVEVKIWGRHGYKEAQRQVESYWTPEVRAGAVVMLTDADVPDEPETYRSRCLDPLAVSVASEPTAPSAVTARLRVTSTTAEGLPAQVVHYFMRLPR